MPPFDPAVHQRRSIRIKGYDYSQSGAYFVTIVVEGRESLFGEIVDGKLRLNALGEIVREEWEKSAQIRREVELGVYVIMPKHFHTIVILVNDAVGATGRSPLPSNGPKPKSLGALMAGFKSSVTKRINETRNTPGAPVWQRNYYACPEPVEGNTSSATSARWTISASTLNPTRPVGMMIGRTLIVRKLLDV